MKARWLAPLAVFVVVILYVAFRAKPMQCAADIAAWVQGVGSLLAIIAAIGIYTKQYKDKQADDEMKRGHSWKRFARKYRRHGTATSLKYIRRYRRCPTGTHLMLSTLSRLRHFRSTKTARRWSER
ncbi:hypothetical protein C7S13_2000 [Burkholderia cepacia]|nr:hypothetical protein [Burkholderia cepacia]